MSRQVAPYRDEVQRSGSEALAESARVLERVSIIYRDLALSRSELSWLRKISVMIKGQCSAR